jgi:hypothetical protein
VTKRPAAPIMSAYLSTNPRAGPAGYQISHPEIASTDPWKETQCRP